MCIVKPTDWKIEPLPANTVTVTLDRLFTQEDMDKIHKGVIPKQMEDKWFIYWKDNSLYFHRSWTGICFYIVQFKSENNTYRMIEANINSEAMEGTGVKKQVDMISFLIDALLLHKKANYPLREASPEKKSLLKWSWIGRALFGEHPND